MPTQRPFLSHFLAAFRAQSAITSGKATSSTTSPSQQAQHQQHSSQPQQPSQPRTITTSAKGPTTTAITSLQSPRAHSTSPLSTSPGTSPAEHPLYGPHPQHSPAQNTAHNTARYIGSGRRGSDSSSEGFRDVLGAEKWYIGGRTAGGEEKYFKLGVIRRQRSVDRLSLDRLSL